MREFWVFYALDTGAYNGGWGSGDVGSAALQQVPEGMGMLAVPREAISPDGSVNPGSVRNLACARIDATAEQVRMQYITPGAGQALTYQYKAAEAERYASDASAATPFLTAEAAARGMTVADLAAEVSAQVAAWIAIGSGIEAARMGGKRAVAEAQTIGAIAAAANVDWAAVLA